MRRMRLLAAALALLTALASGALAEAAEPLDWIAAIMGEGEAVEAPAESGLVFGGSLEIEPGEAGLRVRFAVRNESDRTVAGYWTQVFATDAEGTEIYAHDDGGWWTEGELVPGGEGFTEFVEIPEDMRFDALHTLVLAAAYADGGEWELDTGDPADAAARGLVRDWAWPPEN